MMSVPKSALDTVCNLFIILFLLVCFSMHTSLNIACIVCNDYQFCTNIIFIHVVGRAAKGRIGKGKK